MKFIFSLVMVAAFYVAFPVHADDSQCEPTGQVYSDTESNQTNADQFAYMACSQARAGGQACMSDGCSPDASGSQYTCTYEIYQCD